MRVLSVAPGCIETEAVAAMAQPLAEQAGTDYLGGERIIMQWLSGIPLGRPGPRKSPT